MLRKKFEKHKIILASKSPRRQNLLNELNISFEIKTKEVEEKYPENLYREEIPLFLAKLKSDAFAISENEILITADTIVWLKNEVVGKPKNYNNAVEILKALSGNMHEVLTGCCIRSQDKTIEFCSETKVYFHELSDKEIEFYLDNYKPYDKAGSYGIQEWIGYIAVERIEGSYFNVMGLPIHKIYEELKMF